MRWPDIGRSGSWSPSLLKQGHQLCGPAPKLCAALGKVQEAEGRGERTPQASLARATQRICHQTPRLPGVGTEGRGYRERKKRGGPISAPGRGGDLLLAANLRVKSNPLSSKGRNENQTPGKPETVAPGTALGVESQY